MADSFIFYRSFFKAINRMTKEEAGEAIIKLASYALDGEELPENDPLVDSFIDMAIPLIDANSKRRTDGSKGGRPKKEEKKPLVSKNAKTKKPLVSKNDETEKPNDNVNVNENDNDNENDDDLNTMAKYTERSEEGEGSSVISALKAWNVMAESEGLAKAELRKGSAQYHRLCKILALHGLDKFQSAIENIRTSEFLRGGGNVGWKASFDWLVEGDHFANVLNGSYAKWEFPKVKQKGTKFSNFPEREHGPEYFKALERALHKKQWIANAVGASV